MRRLTSSRREDERGAVLVLSAAFAVVMVAMAALVVDVGALHDERRQLQNGADAAALAVAHTCALGACPATAAATTMASDLANGNAHDSAAKVDTVDMAPVTRRVTVATSTQATDGGTILPYAFAQAVTGSRGKTVHAKATATWSGIAKAETIRLVISACEWDAATNGGTTYNTTFTGPPEVILFHTGGQAADDCGAQAGQDTDGDSRLPGGFGWVDSTNCQATFTVDTFIADADTGADAPNDCDLDTLVGKTVLVPIFDDIAGTGNNGRYHIMGFAQLRVTGYRFPGKTGGAIPCSPPSTCVGGYFVRFVSPAEATGGPDLGATSVHLVS
jgi:Flp pilus assembly protein TadG